VVRVIANSNKKMNKKNNGKSNFLLIIRTIFLLLVAYIVYGILVFRIGYIQFVEGGELSKKAYRQQVTDEILSPSRGTIYDSKGEILAQSVPVDTISLNPGEVMYKNGNEVDNEFLAKGLSEMFELDYEGLLKDLKSNKTVITIKRKVEQNKVDELKNWLSENDISTGINFDADNKRYYPYDSLASNLIGFCGTENNGQTGIEERWNAVLTGTAGKIVTITDAHKQAISDEDEQYVATENGSNIYLTIDTNIQAIAEKYLAHAMIVNPTAVAGNVIIMNPQSGDILAMATNPNYNLNEPSNYLATGLSEEEWNSLEQPEKSERLMNLWKNKAVSDQYEPGSTFKLITSAVALEEGVVQTDTPGDFYCSGVYHVGDRDIKCWSSTPHEAQSLREALEHSCNPAFMQLGQKIGAKLLYKYYDAFGFNDSVGNDIAKAYPGKFYPLEKMGPVELATASFGQRTLNISPLQLITAVSAICNDGILVKPKIVKQIENTDTGSIEIVETENIRQVVSKTTADKVKNMMQSVVTDGTGKHAAVEGYSIGGKSGTSEPTENSNSGYVASFIGISPIENTQVVVLVALYGIQDPKWHQGGQQAGPVVAEILREILPYLGITSNTQEAKETDAEAERLIAVPNVKDKTISEATTELQLLGFNVVVKGEGIDPNSARVSDQLPKYGAVLTDNSLIYLYVENQPKGKVKVPNVKGMNMVDATTTLKASNLNVNITGTRGIVVSQEPIYDAEVDEGTVINVVIKEELRDTQ